MSDYDEFEDDFDEDGGFGRSFLDVAFTSAPAAPAAAEAGDDEFSTRSFLLTGGRTGGGKANVKMETMVIADKVPVTARAGRGMTPEQLGIIEVVSGTAQAVAEVAARVKLPLGVTQVLVGDLVHEGLLITSTAPVTSIHDDIAFIERLISRVAAL